MRRREESIHCLQLVSDAGVLVHGQQQGPRGSTHSPLTWRDAGGTARRLPTWLTTWHKEKSDIPGKEFNKNSIAI